RSPASRSWSRSTSRRSAPPSPDRISRGACYPREMDDVLADLTGAPEAPDAATAAALLDQLARLVAVAGWARFVRPPVVPGPAAFPDRWEPSAAGIATVARRLLAHAGADDLRIAIADRR